MSPNPLTILEYTSSFPKSTQTKLRQIHTAIRASAPKAVESIKWSMPAFSYHRILVMYGGFKHHIGFYPTPKAIRAFAKELKPFKTAKGSIQFPLNKPLPLALIRNITKFRVKESIAEDGKWRSPLKLV